VRDKKHDSGTIFSDFVHRHVTDFFNLTPHEITVHLDSTIHRVPVSGLVARADTPITDEGYTKEGIPVALMGKSKVYVVRCGDRRGKVPFPSPKRGTIYLASVVVAREMMRADVWSPDTSDDGVIRDGRGYIVGVKRFQAFTEDFQW